MSLLTRESLRSLMEYAHHPCVSIYMPTHRTIPDNQQNPIRLKNLLKEAEVHLISRGVRSGRAGELLRPAYDLLEDPGFWEHQRDGLAIFLSPEFLQHYEVPMQFEELVVAADLFHLKPLFKLFNNDGRYFLLTLSQNASQLFEGTQFGLGEVDVPGMPHNIAEALNEDETGEVESRRHLGGQKTAGGGVSMYHGQQGASTPGNTKTRLRRYFQELDRVLQTVLQREHSPLILAGVEYLLPIYREANSYAHLVDEGIEGNVEGLNEKELHERCWPLAQRYFRRAQESAAALYEKLRANQRTSSNIEDIILAADYGRVEYLFVADGVQQWGSFNPSNKEVEMHNVPQNGDIDLLDLAARQTLLNNGTVFALEPNHIPDRERIAAIYRY